MKLHCLVSLLFLASLSLVAQGRNFPGNTESEENDSSLASLETVNSLEKDSSLDDLDRHVGCRDHLTDSNTLFPPPALYYLFNLYTSSFTSPSFLADYFPGAPFLSSISFSL